MARFLSFLFGVLCSCCGRIYGIDVLPTMLQEAVKTDTRTAAFKPLPLPISGKCEKGKTYRVMSIEDLYELIPEIECVWTEGIVPNKVPLGANYGRALTVANSALLDYFLEFIYQGDYVLETKCNGNTFNIGVLNFGGFDLSTGIWTVSALPKDSKFVEGEQYDGREGVLMDFTVTVENYCPYEGKEKAWSVLMNSFNPFQSGQWPYRLFIDMLRTVGRDEDGCIILLGRTWMRDPLLPSKPLATVLYFTLKTCDPMLSPDFVRGTEIGPVPETYSYDRTGALEFISRLNPAKYYAAEKIYPRGRGSPINPSGIFDYTNYVNQGDQVTKNAQPSVKKRNQRSQPTPTITPSLMPNPFNQMYDIFTKRNPILQTWESLLKATTTAYPNPFNFL